MDLKNKSKNSMTEAHHYLRAIRYHLLALLGAVVVLVSISFLATNGWFEGIKTTAQTTQTAKEKCPNWPLLAAKDGNSSDISPVDIAYFENLGQKPIEVNGQQYIGTHTELEFADLNDDGYIDVKDNQCLYELNAETTGKKPIRNGCNGRTPSVWYTEVGWRQDTLSNLSGYTYLYYGLDQDLAATTSSVRVWMVPFSTVGPLPMASSIEQMGVLSYSRDVTAELTAQTDDQKCLILPIDLFPFPNFAKIATYVCTNDSNNCSAVTEVSGNTGIQFTTPTDNAVVSGITTVEVQADGAVNEFLFTLSSASGSTALLQKSLKNLSPISGTTSTFEKYSTTIDTTSIPNGSYILTGYYYPINAKDSKLTQPYLIRTITINNPETSNTTPPFSPIIAPTPGGSDPIVVSNTNTSTTSSAVTIFDASPTAGQSFDQLTTIKGKTSRAGYVQVTIAKATFPSIATTQTVTGHNFSFTLPSSFGLAPGNHEITIRLCDDQSCKNVVTKQTNLISVREPKAQFLVADGRELSGQVTFYATLTGYLKNPQVLIDKVGGLANISLGSLASTIENGKSVWKATVDTSQLPGAGEYTLKIKYLRFDNVIAYGKPLSIRVKQPTTSSATPSAPTIIPPNLTVIPPADQPSTTSGTISSPTTPDITAPIDNTPVVSPKKYVDTYIPKINDDPRISGVVASVKLKVTKIENTQPPAGQKNLLTLSGIGPPNSIVTLFIYSDPLVVTTRTDSDGNWTYTLDNQFSDGEHQVFVTVTSETGKIQEKSNPLSFFISQAQAVTEQEFLARNTVPERSSDSFLRYYLIMAGLLVGLSLVVLAWWRVGRHSTDFPH